LIDTVVTPFFFMITLGAHRRCQQETFMGCHHSNLLVMSHTYCFFVSTNVRNQEIKVTVVAALNGIAATSVMNQLLRHRSTPSLHRLIGVNCIPRMHGAKQEVIKASLWHKK